MDDLSLPSILENLHMGHNYMATITIQPDLMGHVNQPWWNIMGYSGISNHQYDI
jgi:hypothetical protein